MTQAPSLRRRTSAEPTPEAAPPRIAYLVLGMHRSGTSAVTQLLALAGARLPAHVMPGDEHNAKGYFEPWRIAVLNDERLRAAGGAWDDPFGFPFRPLPASDEANWRERAARLFAQEYRRVRFPLIKDPRMTVLMPMWRPVLEAADLQLRCVIPVRHPLAVAGSLARRDGFPPEKSVLLWTAYMLAAEAYTRDLPRAFVNYDALLADWRGEVARIEATHGAPLPKLTPKGAESIDAFLSPELRHNESEGNLDGLGWIGELAADVFHWFQAAAAEASLDPGPLEAAGRTLAQRQSEVGSLVSSVTRDLDAARHDLREAHAQHEVDIRHARAQLEEVRAQLEAQLADVRSAWRRDVDGLQAELEVFYRAVDKAEHELDAAILKS